MDVHAETIAAAIAEPDGEIRSLGTIPNRMESVRKLIKKPLGVAAIGLHPVTSLHRDQRRRDHLALHTQLCQLPVKNKSLIQQSAWLFC